MALNTVAAIGSTMLSADAMPTGKCFIDHVNRKNGIINVTSPRPTHSGTVRIGDNVTFSIKPTGSHTATDIKQTSIKIMY